MKLNRKWLLIIALIMSMAVATGGTLAYLTDRDSEVNVFTIGNVSIDLNEDFKQGAELIPGVDITKAPTITNTGNNDAWVWVTIAIPAALDNDDPSQNVIHFNYSADSVADGLWQWQNNGSWMVAKDVEHEGVDYNVYTVLYGTALKPGETTKEPVIYKVYMDDHIDIDPNGQLNHVEKGVVTELDWNIDTDGNPMIFVSAYAMQTNEFASVMAAYEAYTAQWSTNGFATTALEWGVPAPLTAPVDTWDGTADTSWYNDTDTEFTITTAEQLAGLANLVDSGVTFEGKTIKLGRDIDLGLKDENGEAICFDPIGSYRHEQVFMGTFDGQGHTIKNLNQNTWQLNNGYYYSDLGLGLFACVEDATIKNLTMDYASLSGESALCGIVAATAYGECTFENITVTNSQAADYQYYAGGIVAWASGNHVYKNCTIAETTTIAAQWGDFNNSTGGVIGGASSSATILFKDCIVACRIDAYNDVTSAYQWYSYRNCGMLIGNTGSPSITSGTANATAPQLTCENVTVIYGDWANYTYCEFSGTSYPYVRVQAGVSNSAYSNPRYGHPTDANGNEVVDDTHLHHEGEGHQIPLTFDQLYGGPASQHYCVYGTAAHNGVTVVYNNK